MGTDPASNAPAGSGSSAWLRVRGHSLPPSHFTALMHSINSNTLCVCKYACVLESGHPQSRQAPSTASLCRIFTSGFQSETSLQSTCLASCDQSAGGTLGLLAQASGALCFIHFSSACPLRYNSASAYLARKKADVISRVLDASLSSPPSSYLAL